VVACVLQGAPEGVLDRCQFVRLGTEKVPMTPALKAEINKQCKFYGTGRLTYLFTSLTRAFCDSRTVKMSVINIESETLSLIFDEQSNFLVASASFLYVPQLCPWYAFLFNV